ncbi:MAG: hypothetical protein KDJ28_00590 [Candidatus Competibacteraceae bacterium]|nr:hypothetical protein [Candidatus Competibacteraceae bacterium]
MKYPPWANIAIVQRGFDPTLNVTAADIRDAARVFGYPVAGSLIQRRVDTLPPDFFEEVATLARMRQRAEARRAS